MWGSRTVTEHIDAPCLVWQKGGVHRVKLCAFNPNCFMCLFKDLKLEILQQKCHAVFRKSQLSQFVLLSSSLSCRWDEFTPRIKRWLDVWTNPQPRAMDTYMTRTKTGIKGKKKKERCPHINLLSIISVVYYREKREQTINLRSSLSACVHLYKRQPWKSITGLLQLYSMAVNGERGLLRYMWL